MRLLICCTLFLSAGWAIAQQGSTFSDNARLGDSRESPMLRPSSTAGWQTLISETGWDRWQSSNFGGDGEVEFRDKTICLGIGGPLTGVTWSKAELLPRKDYELRLQARRVEGRDFFCGLTFPYLESHATLILGGWGGSLVGISSLNGRDASENETMTHVSFENGRWYDVRLRAREGYIQAWLDDRSIVSCLVKKRQVGTRMEVDPSKPLGVAAYETRAEIRAVQIRWLTETNPASDH